VGRIQNVAKMMRRMLLQERERLGNIGRLKRDRPPPAASSLAQAAEVRRSHAAISAVQPADSNLQWK